MAIEDSLGTSSYLPAFDLQGPTYDAEMNWRFSDSTSGIAYSISPFVDYANRNNRMLTIPVEITVMHLSQFSPAPEDALRIAISGACDGVYKLSTDNTPFNSQSTTMLTGLYPRNTVFTPQRFYLHVRTGNTLTNVPSSCFILSFVNGVTSEWVTMPPIAAAGRVGVPVPSAYVNFHYTNLIYGSTLSPSSLTFGVTREFAVMPSQAPTPATHEVTLTGVSGCFCPSGGTLSIVSSSGSDLQSTAVTCTVKSFSEPTAVLTCDTFTKGTWNIFALRCGDGFTQAKFDLCFGSINNYKVNTQVSFNDGSMLYSDQNDAPVFAPNMTALVSAVQLLDRTLTAKIVESNPASTPSTVTVTYYLYFITLPPSSGNNVTIDFGFLSGYATTTSSQLVFGSSTLATRCTQVSLVRINCLPPASRYDPLATATTGVPTFSITFVSEATGMLIPVLANKFKLLTTHDSQTTNIGYAAYSTTQVTYAFYVGSNGFDDSANTVVEDINVLILPLSPAAAASAAGSFEFQIVSPCPFKFTSGAYEATSPNATAPAAVWSSASTLTLTLGKAPLGSYFRMNTTDGMSAPDSIRTMYLSGVGPECFNLRYLGTPVVNNNNPLGTLLGPYPMYLPTNITLDIVKSELYDYTMSGISRALTIKLSIHIGVNKTFPTLEIVSKANCGVSFLFATLTVANGFIISASANSSTLRFGSARLVCCGRRSMSCHSCECSDHHSRHRDKLGPVAVRVVF